MYQRFREVYARITAIVAISSGVAILIMMAYSFLNASLRYLFNFPLHGLVEATEQLMIYVIFLGAAYCQVHKENVRVDALLVRVSPRTRILLDIFTYATGLIFFFLVGWFTINPALASLKIHEKTLGGIVGYPMYPQKFAVVIGMFLLSIQLLLDLIESAKQLVVKSR